MSEAASSDTEDIRKLNVEQFCDYLVLKFDNDVVESFRANKITGSVFLQLTEEHIGKIVTALGDVVQLINLRTKILVSLTGIVSYIVTLCF